MRPQPRLPSAVVASLVGFAAFGCDRRAALPVSQRLADVYKPELVANRASLPSPPPRTEWRFDAEAPAKAPVKSHVVARLKVQLAAWRQAAEAARLKPDATHAVSGEELERLRSLGYVQ